MVVVTIVLGNVWSVLDPWRAAADAVAWCARKAGWSREARPYPAVARALAGRRSCSSRSSRSSSCTRTSRSRGCSRSPSRSTASRRGRGWRSSAAKRGGRTATGSPCTSASSHASRSSAAAGTPTAGRSSFSAVRCRSWRAYGGASRRRRVPRRHARIGRVRRPVALLVVVRAALQHRDQVLRPGERRAGGDAAQPLRALPRSRHRGDGLHGLGEDRGGRRRPARGVQGHLRREPDPDRDRVRAVPLPLGRCSSPTSS